MQVAGKMNDIETKAFQEMETVKEMIARNDHREARDKLLKLQRQFPAVDEFSRMITVCDVLNSANFDFSDGETDWYLVLLVPQTAAEQDVQSHYNKFSTLLKPIKSHLPAAGSALKIVEEAYSVLSNPEKRSLFDKKRTTKFETCELLNVQQIHAVDSRHGSPLAETIVQNNEISPTPSTSERATQDSPQSRSRIGTAPADSGTKLSESENKWSIRDFACNQIWAVRDDPAAVPRRYVGVNNVDPEGEIWVTFLEPNPMTAVEIRWAEKGLPIACGSFKAGKTTNVLGACHFSHQVKCERSQHDSSDLADESEILVASLVEVPGFMTFFQRQHYNGYKLIPIPQFLSFSRQIEAFRVQTTKDNGISTPFWHLEPDFLFSTPPEQH